MTPKPLLNPSTEQKLDQIIKNPPQSLLLTGPAGLGKATVAHWLASSYSVGPHVLSIEPEPGKVSIGIEAVRQLEHFLSLKVAGANAINRIVLIIDAHMLTHEAQNAMLKTLEEPPQGTILILTSSQQESLLPTVLSRLQVIEVQRPTITALSALLNDVDIKRQQQIIALSGGLPGLAIALKNGDESEPLVEAATVARQLLQSGSFEKLKQVDTLSKNKQTTANVLYILMQMAHTALLTSSTPDRWQKVMTAAYETESDIKNGTQPKLALTKLMLSL